MNNKQNLPKRGVVYTLAEITKLFLRDSPCLQLRREDYTAMVIQNSSVDEREVVEKLPGAADTKWRFIRETHEWIPVFVYSDENERPYTDFVIIERDNDRENEWWVCWKGFYRPQHVYTSPTLSPAAVSSDSWASIPGWDAMAKSSDELPALPAEVIVDIPELTEVVNPNQPFTSAQDYAKNHDVAVAYLAKRDKDLVKFKEQPLEWKDNDLAQTAKLYQSGIVLRYKDNHPYAPTWGGYYPKLVGGTQPPSVQFASEECFHAWVLARFW